MADLVAEPLVAAVAELHPGVELRFQTGYSGHVQRWLDDGDLDLSLLERRSPIRRRSATSCWPCPAPSGPGLRWLPSPGS